MSNHRAQLDRAFKVKVEQKLEKTVRATSLLVLGELIKNTPVDTGRAKSNWWPEINVVSVEIREPSSGNEAQGLAVAARYKLTDTIYISNNLPYIRRLNEGHSTQSPAGFVEAAVQAGVQKANEFAKRLK
jgi:hypothetical protein